MTDEDVNQVESSESSLVAKISNIDHFGLVKLKFQTRDGNAIRVEDWKRKSLTDSTLKIMVLPAPSR